MKHGSLVTHGVAPSQSSMASAPVQNYKRMQRLRVAFGLLNKGYYDHHITYLLRKTFPVSAQTACKDLRICRELLARHYGKEPKYVKVDLLAIADSFIVAETEYAYEYDGAGNVTKKIPLPPVPPAVRMEALKFKAQVLGFLKPDRNINVSVEAKVHVKTSHRLVVEMLKENPQARDAFLNFTRSLQASRGGGGDDQ